MNILYYLDYFPKLSESFILNEIYYLTGQGHNVAVFSLNKPDQNLSHEELDEIDVDIAYASQPSPRYLSSILGKSIFDENLSYVSGFSSIKHRIGCRFLSKQCLEFVDSLGYEIDHVHSHFARWNKVPATLVADTIGASSSLTTHAYDLYASPDENVLKTTCDAFDSVFTISEYNAQFINVEIDPDANVEVIRMGVRTEKFQPTTTTGEPRLLTIARFVEKKGIEYALHAVAEVVDEYPNLDYRLIGSGPRKERYERIITERDIEENVTFLGSISDDKLINELDCAKAFLLPCVVAKSGNRDGIPVVLMEAMAMETPPITTHMSGIPELVDDWESGILINSRDVENIAESVREVLKNDGLREDLGHLARLKVDEEFHIERVGEKLEKSLRFNIN
jgi:glycosyltransferase involved in cell wall biosynthesis